MTNDFIPSSELILNADGSVYHLCLKPSEVAETIITVGDQDRVYEVTKHFDKVEFERQSREFKTATGIYKGKRLTVISTGIGTDNVDIVLNELDALFQIDFTSRSRKEIFTHLQFIRIGTSGSIQENVLMDSFLASEKALSFDGLLPFYNHGFFKSPESWPAHLNSVKPLITDASAKLIAQIPANFTKGITATMPGFYAPQGRSFRLPSVFSKTLNELRTLQIEGKPITNIEMETAGIYGLSSLLGHDAISFNAILANRASGEFSTKAKQTIDGLIETVLDWTVNFLD